MYIYWQVDKFTSLLKFRSVWLLRLSLPVETPPPACARVILLGSSQESLKDRLEKRLSAAEKERDYVRQRLEAVKAADRTGRWGEMGCAWEFQGKETKVWSNGSVKRPGFRGELTLTGHFDRS